MKTVNEYRVRPVIRWNLTHWHQTTDDAGSSGGVRSLGEFESERQAEEARSMYEKANRTIRYSRIVAVEPTHNSLRGVTYYAAPGRVFRAYDQGALGLESVTAVEYREPGNPDDDSGRMFTLERRAYGQVWAEIEVRL